MNPSSISIHIQQATIHVARDRLDGVQLINLSATDQIRAEGDQRFQLVLDGNAVTDHSTGLMWARNVSDELTWDDAFKYCRDFRLGGFDDWRMAQLDERIAITDYDRHAPALHPHFNWCADYEWTAKRTHWTEDKTGSSRSFWYVYMSNGGVYGSNADGRFRVRPVRVASPAGQ